MYTNNKGHFFLTLDFEEWYHLDYFKKYNFEKRPEFVHSLSVFFEFLRNSKIQITVFVLAELAEQYPELIKKISEDGHEIACHGFDHELLTCKTNEEFKRQVKKAKELLEQISGKPVLGYRASCFSMNREKLEVLRDLGFKYDSSYIRFTQHALYNEIDMTGFLLQENLIYENKGFYEFELPTLALGKHRLPISGGGYFRIFPSIIYRYLFKKFYRQNSNFNFYIHPFEVVEKQFVPVGISLKEKIRYNLGRKGNLKRFQKFILSIKESYDFSTIQDYLQKYNLG